jgi:WD40 repeat protein
MSTDASLDGCDQSVEIKLPPNLARISSLRMTSGNINCKEEKKDPVRLLGNAQRRTNNYSLSIKDGLDPPKRSLLSRQNTIATSNTHHSTQESPSSRSGYLTAEDVLLEARKELERARGQKSEYAINEERTRRIVQEAINASKRRDIQMRSTQEVLRMARTVLPIKTADTAMDHYSCQSDAHSTPRRPTEHDDDHIGRCLSPTESSLASIDDLEKAIEGLPSKFSNSDSSLTMSREKMLNLIDGIDHGDEPTIRESFSDDDILLPSLEQHQISKEGEDTDTTVSTTFSSLLDYFLGSSKSNKNQGRLHEMKTSLRDFSPLACGAIHLPNDIDQGNSVSRRATIGAERPPPPYTERTNERVVDPRMPGWIADISDPPRDEEPLSQYFYALGKSRTVIVHEIIRGNWTWCTAWSPDGNRLAVATENHHLAVVDTSASTVWRVRHDRRIKYPAHNHTTHSIRAIAWGSQFIAIGGTGNAISILSPIEPYPVVHTIKGTGFVGTLDWRHNSTVLAIGSREDKCSLYKVSVAEDNIGGEIGTIQRIISQELCTITRTDWVNKVAFSPGGSILAIGDNSGKLSVYSFESHYKQPPKLDKITNFKFEAAILDVEWSPDGMWLYAGGEDFAMTIIETSNWQVKQRIARDRWMQFVASSNRGTHVAVGGGNSEVTILNAQDEWKSSLSFELKGLVPLSAKWHPRDQFLAITGQDNSILAIETTNARHIKGHYLQSISPIVEVEFSPDGQMLAVGNEAGVVSFYRSDESSFVTAYEIVLADGCSQSIVWSPNGSYIMVGSGDTLAIIGQASEMAMGPNVPPRTSGLGIRKVIRDVDKISCIAIHMSSRYVAMVGVSLSILDAANDFNYVRRFELGSMKACAWSLDGTWLATTGESSNLIIFDTSNVSVTCWRKVFTLDCVNAGNALAWGPSLGDGLQYLAYGGDNQTVTIIEIRTLEGTWETVLRVERNGAVHDLDWSERGLLAVALGDGTVTIMDLAYLKSGCAVNEMDYNWQRQGVTCFTEIRRNRGKNEMTTIRWIPAQASEESLLAIGGSDGALEVIDLTERSRCKGFGNAASRHP